MIFMVYWQQTFLLFKIIVQNKKRKEGKTIYLYIFHIKDDDQTLVSSFVGSSKTDYDDDDNNNSNTNGLHTHRFITK